MLKHEQAAPGIPPKLQYLEGTLERLTFQNEENGYNLLQKVIDEYKEFDFKQVECYKAVSEEMKRDGVISYSYLHKRLSKMSAIKNAIEGTTEKIKQLVEEAKTNCILSELPPNLCKEAYKTTARLFKIA